MMYIALIGNVQLYTVLRYIGYRVSGTHDLVRPFNTSQWTGGRSLVCVVCVCVLCALALAPASYRMIHPYVITEAGSLREF